MSIYKARGRKHLENNLSEHYAETLEGFLYVTTLYFKKNIKLISNILKHQKLMGGVLPK